MKASLFRLYRAAKCLKLSQNPAVLARLSGFPKLDLSVLQIADGSRVLIAGTQVEATTPGREFLLRGSEQVARLLREAGAKFSPLPDGVLLDVEGVKLKLQTWEELFIATEVFCDGIYNLKTGGEFALIDVGMNVGATSLFFARQPACNAIYSFELFPKTAAKARTNLALNPEIAQKIQVTNKGVAAHASSAELNYNEEHKGSVGRHGLPDYAIADPAVRYEKVKVDFIACDEVVAAARSKHPGLTLVCKLDCEGAEYEILETLDKSGLLREVACWMIEWHEKSPKPIEAVLQKNGFELLSFTPGAPNHGMIYAWRRSAGEPATPRR